MKKITLLIIIFFMYSCSILNTEKQNIDNSSYEYIDEKKLKDIRNILKPDDITEEKISNNTGEELITNTKEELKNQTWSKITENKKQINNTKNKVINKNIDPKIENILESSWTEIKNENIIQNTESWIFTEEELNIINNITEWEVDKLIDILFKDL